MPRYHVLLRELPALEYNVTVIADGPEEARVLAVQAADQWDSDAFEARAEAIEGLKAGVEPDSTLDVLHVQEER